MKKDKYCRPSTRINDDTPMTVDELVEKHGKQKIIDFIDNRTSKKSVDWINLK